MKGRVLPFETPNVQSRRVSDCTLQSWCGQASAYAAPVLRVARVKPSH